MRKIAFIHSGSFFHLADVADPAIVATGATPLYGPELVDGALDAFDSVYLAARLHPAVLAHVTPHIVQFLARPGTRLYVDGENAVGTWLPGTTETPRGTNFWAWRIGEDVGRRSVNQDHPLWNYLSEHSVHWHYHGVLTHPSSAVPLVRLEEIPRELWRPSRFDMDYHALPGGHPNTLMYYDAGTFAGEVVVSTMDAAYHHGSGFMPGATQLLYRMLRWLGDSGQLQGA